MFKYKNININYVDYGNKSGSTILYLHGWGQNIAMMKPIADPFQKDFRIVILDLPGFGESDEPQSAWTLEEYVDAIHALVEELKIKKLNIIGHSFGGKLTILYASKYPVNKIMLLASPFKKSNKTTSLKTKVIKKAASLPGLKSLASILKQHMGSTDYKNASPVMREILVKHVNTDLTEEAKRVKAPTFIIWGDADEAVPVNDAYELDNIISDTGLTVYPGCTHYAYLENLNQTNRIIKAFFD